MNSSTTDKRQREKIENELTEKQKRILSYLQDQVNKTTYFKSRIIGDSIGLSPCEVGSNIAKLQEIDCGISIESWGYSSSTTWKVCKD